MASPAPLVPTVTVLVPVLANVALAPLDGAVNVTLTPAAPVTGHPVLLTTDTASAVWNIAPTRAVWGVPADNVIVSAVHGVAASAGAACDHTSPMIAATRAKRIMDITPSSGLRSGKGGRHARPEGSRRPRRWRARRRAHRPSPARAR